MSNVLTDFRAAVATYLRTNLKGGTFTVLSGERDGPATEKLACVFVPSIANAANILFASPPLIVRAWIPKPRTPRAQRVGVDPAPLEQLAVDLMTTLKPVGTTLLPGELYFWVSNIDFDYTDWGVQATLTSYTQNPAVSGA